MNINKLFEAIDQIEKAEAEDLMRDLPDFTGKSLTVSLISDFETLIDRELKKQQQYYLNAYQSHISKGIFDTFLNKLTTLFGRDKFANNLASIAERYLLNSTGALTKQMLDEIDPKTKYKMGKKTKKFIKDWSKELGQKMQLTSHKAMQRVFENAIKNNSSVETVTQQLEQLPQFDRQRAKRVATTEMLTISQVAMEDAFNASDKVVGKRWRHHPSKNPRHNHERLDGTEIGLNEEFDVSGEKCRFPRDTSLSPGERIHCHCTLEPVYKK